MVDRSNGIYDSFMVFCGILLIIIGILFFKKFYLSGINLLPVIMSIIAVSIVFTCKYSGCTVLGDCLYKNWGNNQQLFDKRGNTIFNERKSLLDWYVKGGDAELNRYWFEPNVVSDARSGAANVPGGPYFYTLKSVTIECNYSENTWTYDSNDKRVNYKYDDYQVEYVMSVYNSRGVYVEDYRESYSFEYFPNGKKIDGKTYKYAISYDEQFTDGHSLVDHLNNMIYDDLMDYLSSINHDSKIFSSETFSATTKSSKVEPEPKKPQKHVTQVPVQRFKPCPSCLGGGLCSSCNGSGRYYHPTGSAPCAACGGMGRCSVCAGRGGEYYTEYETRVEYY